MDKNTFEAQKALLNKEDSENNVQIKAISTTPQVVQVERGKQSWWRADEAMTISSVVLIFGVLVLFLAAWTMRKTVVSADSILRVFGTIIIIIGSIFLVVVGYTEQQMAPVMGLLGTVAGYLLGKSNSSESNAIAK